MTLWGLHRRYAKTVLVADLVCALFGGIAAYHLHLKAGLPPELAPPPAGTMVVGLNGVRVSSSADLEYLLAPCRIGDRAQVEIERDGVRSTLPCVLVPMHTQRFILIMSLVGLIFFLVGMLAYLFRPNEEAARIFHWGSLAVAVGTVGSEAIYALQPEVLGFTLYALFSAASHAIGPLFAHLTMVFPRRKFSKKALWMAALYSVPVALAIWQTVTFLTAARLHSMEWFAASMPGKTVYNVVLLVYLIFSIANFIHSYRTSQGATEKRKLRWILFGLSAGPAPFVLFWILPSVLGARALLSEELNILCLGVIPVTFAISIVKYRLMDIDFIINRGTVYAAIIGVLLAVYMMVVGMMTAAVGRTIENPSVVPSAIAAMIVALLFEPTRKRVEHVVDTWFFHVRYDFREVQRAFLEQVKQCVDLQQLAKLIVDRSSEVLTVERIAFLTLQEPEHLLRLIAHRNFDVLARHAPRFQAEKLKSSLQLPVGLEDKIERGVAFEPTEDPPMFHRWQLAIALPMMTESGEKLGFLVLGEKKGGERFTAEDVDLLSTMAAQAGSAIERVTLAQMLMMQRAEAQRLEELNQMKSYFVSSVTHDLKTPLTSIRMFTDILRKALLTARKHKSPVPLNKALGHLRTIQGESERLARLIDNVLDFSRIERGVKKYDFTDADVSRPVREVIRSMEYLFKTGRFKVRTNLLRKKIVMRVDVDAMREAFINLLSNAMKYSVSKKELTISSFLQGDDFVIKVEDRGMGISPEHLKAIFDPYYRASGTKADHIGGVGLGLGIVKDIMDAHGGRCEVESELGKGSAFALHFPRHTAEATA